MRVCWPRSPCSSHIARHTVAKGTYCAPLILLAFYLPTPPLVLQLGRCRMPSCRPSPHCSQSCTLRGSRC